MARRFPGMLIGAVLVVTAGAEKAFGQVEGATAKGIEFLKKALPGQGNLGEAALGTLAMVKLGVPATDPIVEQLLVRVASSAVDGVYRNQRNGGPDNYEAAVVLMCLAAADPDKFYDEIQTCARYLMSKQTESGAWDYDNGKTGDTSMSQYAVLALWEASNLGIDVPMPVWDKALHWFITRQDPSGGFVYHPTPPPGEQRIQQDPVTHSMSAAGAGTMIICRSRLPFPKKRQNPLDRELLEPVIDDALLEYEPLVTREKADEAIELAQKWMNGKMTIGEATGPVFYYLYGLERYASFAEQKQIGGTDWYSAGSKYITGKQEPDGGWRGQHAGIPDTSFCLLFLGKSTAKSISKVRITYLEKGTLIGGRGMPDGKMPDGSVARQQSRYRQALKAPVEKLLEALGDLESDDTEQASVAAALETIDPEQLVKSLAGDVKKLRRKAKDPRPEVRRAVLAALGRTKDYRVVPLLIGGLSDSDPEVYRASLEGLRFLSRRLDGMGLPSAPPSKPELDAGIARWKDWSAQLNIQVEPIQEYDE